MIYWDEEKNKKLLTERDISFEEIAEIILRNEYLDILENPARDGQLIFIVRIKSYIYVVPFIIDQNESIFLKTAFPSRKFNKMYSEKL
jgi:uncharacterized DUF497 family protein